MGNYLYFVDFKVQHNGLILDQSTRIELKTSATHLIFSLEVGGFVLVALWLIVSFRKLPAPRRCSMAVVESGI